MHKETDRAASDQCNEEAANKPGWQRHLQLPPPCYTPTDSLHCLQEALLCRCKYMLICPVCLNIKRVI